MVTIASWAGGLSPSYNSPLFLLNPKCLRSQLQAHGAIWFRNFESTKQPDGFREFYEALQLNPCLDPIHTSGLRAMEEKKHAVYEAVNKHLSLKKWRRGEKWDGKKKHPKKV